jgi:hypothetical protein
MTDGPVVDLVGLLDGGGDLSGDSTRMPTQPMASAHIL